MKFLAEGNFNYIEYSDLKINQNINLDKNIQRGVNVLIYKDYTKADVIKNNLIQLVSKKYKNIKINYCSSLIYNEKSKDIITNYKKIIDVDNNLTFRRLFNSLIPKHQEYLNNKYSGRSNLKNFYLFPGADLNFICLLFSLSIMKDNNEIYIPLISENFLYIFDNLTLTSACKLLNEQIHMNKKLQFICFVNNDSIFVTEYKKFYNFNYVNIN